MLETLGEQQFIIYAKATETHRLIESWMDEMAGKIKKPLVLGDMQAIKEMAKLGTGVGIVASWVAASEIADGSLSAIKIPGSQIEREWGVFHSATPPAKSRRGGFHRAVRNGVLEHARLITS